MFDKVIAKIIRVQFFLPHNVCIPPVFNARVRGGVTRRYFAKVFGAGKTRNDRTTMC